MIPEEVLFTTDDGYPIAGRIFVPNNDQKGAVVIGPAMGVVQEFYAPFAVWLADQGYVVITFDYRGVGKSLRGSLRDIDADIFDWARQDSSAALEKAAARSKGTPITWIGHSLGGQITPLIRNISSVTKIITVAAGNGYWRENAKPLRYYAHVLWFVIMPLALKICGYFPGRRLHIVGDLPAGVISQWRRWCLHPRYVVGAEGSAVEAEYTALKLPIHALAFDDDEMMSRKGIATLHGLFENADVTLQHIRPADVGVKRIGHFGFFRPSIGRPIWESLFLLKSS